MQEEWDIPLFKLDRGGNMEKLKEIKQAIEPVINENGYLLDSLTYEKENNVNSLVVVIDKQGVIDVEDCVTVSNLINPILDEIDLIDESYVLDVCTKERGDNNGY